MDAGIYADANVERFIDKSAKDALLEDLYKLDE